MERIKIGRLELDVQPFNTSRISDDIFTTMRYLPHQYAKTFYMWDCEAQKGLPDPAPERVNLPSKLEPVIYGALTKADHDAKTARANAALVTSTGLSAAAFRAAMRAKFGTFHPKVPYARILDPYKATEKLYLRVRASYLTLVMTPVGAPRGTAFLNHVPVSAVFTTNFVGTCRPDGEIRKTQPTFSGRRAIKGLNKKMLDEDIAERARQAREDLWRLGVPMHEDDEPLFDEELDEMFEEMIEEWIEEELEEEREFEDWLDQLENDEGESEGQ